MRRLLIFGGTSEGRELAEFCRSRDIPADVSVTTGYGAELLGSDGLVNVLTGRLDSREMSALMRSEGYAAVIDATHPYAAEATGNIKKACADSGMPYYRLIRERCAVTGKTAGTAEELVKLLNESDGVILSALGSKELPVLAEVTDSRKRIWLRVLPAEGIAEYCASFGFDPGHVITGKGPFTVEENLAHIKRSGARILVTKESGIKGGYPEKAEAAEKAGIELITLTRPAEEGCTPEKMKELIGELML